MRRSSRLEAVSETKNKQRLQMRAKLLDPRIKARESRNQDHRFSSGSSESDEDAKKKVSQASTLSKRKFEHGETIHNRKRNEKERFAHTNTMRDLPSLNERQKPKSILKQQTATAPEGNMERNEMFHASAMNKKEISENRIFHRRPSHLKNRSKVSQQCTSDMSATRSYRSRDFTSHTNPTHTVTKFYHEILNWNLYKALRREMQKVSDSNEISAGSEEGEVEITKVPSQFETYEQYFAVWEPLAIQEVQAQAVNSVLSESPKPIPTRLMNLHKDNVASAVSCKVRAESLKIKGYGAYGREPLDGFFTNDLVLLSPCEDYLDEFQRNGFMRSALTKEKQNGDSNIIDLTEDSDVISEPVGALAIVSSQYGSREGFTLTVLTSHYAQIRKEQVVFLFKLHNLTTSIREYRALCDCKYYELMPLLLSGKHEDGSMKLDSLGLEYVRWLKRTFNDSQLEAITASATSEGFTLIKGPPGTGKTTTLKGLLNSLHLREYNRYYNAVLDVARQPDSETSKAWAAVNNEKPHILVAAPSNAAVDNIVGKIMEEGFCDGEGRRYFPQIVRVGRGMSANVRSVGLDDMVDQICSQPLEVLDSRIMQLRHDLAIVERDSGFIREELRQIVRAIELDPDAFIPPATLSTDAAPSCAKLKPTHDCATSSAQNADIVSAPKSTTTSKGPNSDEEDENDEPFPASFPPLTNEDTQFNQDETACAYNELMKVEDSSAEEDEPLPVHSQNRSAESVLHSGLKSNKPISLSNKTETASGQKSPPAAPCESTLDHTSAEELSEPSSTLPSPTANCASSGSPLHVKDRKPRHQTIDYAQCEEYRTVAQRINCCLERRGALLLELQRYEFARRVVLESGKPSQALRHALEVSFLETAHIVFTTLSSAGVAALDASSRYDVLVIDEAAQAVELSTIIPMKFGSRQCVLVGDPQQLSATTFSRTSVQSFYERSLFERLESCGHPVHMLRTQYRSHPTISEFPRNYFYEGKLQDGENVLSPSYTKCYHNLFGPAFQPLVFWNLVHSRDSVRSVSRMNLGEVDLAVNLYLTLKHSCPPDAIAGRVGIITPYSQQMEELRARFRKRLGDRYEAEVEINTVDGFQGREKDIIILSTVRGDPRAGIGFLNDIRRMNVALTRAKYACYVLGNENTLRSSRPWASFLDFVYDKRCIVHVDDPACNLTVLRPMDDPVHEDHNELGRREGAPQIPSKLFPASANYPGHERDFRAMHPPSKSSTRKNINHSAIGTKQYIKSKSSTSFRSSKKPSRTPATTEHAVTRPIMDNNCPSRSDTASSRNVSSRDPRRLKQSPVTS